VEVAENISTVVENRISPTTIYEVVDDEEQARSVIRSAIEGHPVFYHLYESIFVKNDNTA
jgi:hypothetical protein